MLYTVPDYYGEFRCIAEQCQDTCCAGWEIFVDKQSLKKYRKIRGGFKKRMVCSVNWLRGTFRQTKDKRCAFLNEDNLCDMYVALGRKSLCRTCRLYPRHIEEFEGIREIGLSMSCPEAARILMQKKDSVTFHSVEKEGDEEFEDFDLLLYSELADAREVMIRILQNRSLDIWVRARLILGLAHDMQGRVNRGELFSCGELFKRYESDAARRFTESRLQEEKTDMEKSFQKSVKLFGNLYQLELLREDWDNSLKEAGELLYWKGAGAYVSLREDFADWTAEEGQDWAVQKEQLLVYFVFTYFCGAVYDGQIYSKVLLAAVSVFLIEELLIARWLRNEKSLDMEDVVEVVYRYAREVEHSDENLIKLEMMQR